MRPELRRAGFEMEHIILAVTISLALIGCSKKDDSPEGPAHEAPTAADVAAGKILAERECRGCHGLDGRGTAPGIPHLAAQSERYLQASIAAYREGTRTHAALRDMAVGMSAADLGNVVGYYASLPPVAAAAEGAAPVFQPYEHGKEIRPPPAASAMAPMATRRLPGSRAWPASSPTIWSSRCRNT